MDATYVFGLMVQSLRKSADKYFRTFPSVAITFGFETGFKGLYVVKGDWDLVPLEWHRDHMWEHSFGIPCHLYLSRQESVEGRISLFVNPQFSLEERERLLNNVISSTSWLYSG
jgi:hypothetical protein